MSAMLPAIPSRTRTLGTLLWAEAIAFSRSWRSLLWTIALPVLMLMLGARRGTSPNAILIFSVAGLVTGTFALGIMGYGNALASYRERGIFQLLRCSPAPASHLLAARLLVQLGAVLAEGIVVLLAARLLYGVSPDAAGTAALFLLLPITGLAALALGQVVAAFTRQVATTTAVSRVLLIVLFLSEGAVAGPHDWPDWLQTLANWSPVQLSQKVLSAALVKGSVTAADGQQLTVLLLWTLVLGYVGLTHFHWEQD